MKRLHQNPGIQIARDGLLITGEAAAGFFSGDMAGHQLVFARCDIHVGDTRSAIVLDDGKLIIDVRCFTLEELVTFAFDAGVEAARIQARSSPRFEG